MMIGMNRYWGPLAILLLILPLNAPGETGNSKGEGQHVSGGVLTPGQDARVLNDMLHAFLSASDTRKAHETFWAEDLVYTSSSGKRFGKAEILKGFDSTEESEDNGPSVLYTGEDVNIRLFETTAVITFKLVGTPDDGSAVNYYFNTGTFQKQDGKWKAVAWQATAIPKN